VLKQNRWVSDAKLADDQRKTWYELREPMLRHHVQWRTKGGEPLRLIVDLLRDWYGLGELRPTEIRSRRVADARGVLGLLERARAGDQEARMRLPAELRPLTEPRPA